MVNPILMPKPGQMTEECSIIRWLKKEGDPVVKGDVLFEIETDKAAMEVEAFHEGVLLKIVVKEGVPVPVQSVCGFVGQPGEAVPDVAPPPPPAAKPAEAAAAPAARAAAPVAAAAAGAPAAAPVAFVPAAPAAPALFRISPRAKRFAADSVIDPKKVKGSGPEGRITEKDIRAYLDAKGYASLRIAPAAKELAAKEGLDILEIRGSGEGGRITVADVQRGVAEKPKTMSKMRQVIAQRLTQSFTSTPHIFVTVSVDMTDLVTFRNALKKGGAPYTVTDFILHATAQTLIEMPEVNSTTDGKQVWWHSKVNMGLAVALEKGLVVPVIWSADELSLMELHDRNAELSKKARDGKLLPDEMTGSTFTISNMGMLGVEQFTAIINPGEAAILAVSSTMPQPVVKDHQIVIRQMMKITVSVDHRLIDGAMAARFVNAVKVKLEDVERWRRMV
jgi:pyruvate dehydrogenase E2 component (dihydrolipoamide acetyltransferase)